jgi:uncharacterized protein
MKAVNLLTLVLIIVGGINWGLVAMNFNLVEAIFGIDTTLTNLVYALVGLSALWQIIPLTQAMRTGEVNAEAANKRHNL